MAANVILTREKTRNESRRTEYRQLVPASFQKHPAKFPVIHGRHEVLEGSAIEEIVILEFPPSRTPPPGITAPNNQAAREHRFRGGDCRCIISEGLLT